MNQQPDKLFRDKLHDYESRLSPDAWKRVAGTRARGFATWYKVAATLTLLAVAASLLLLRAPHEQSTQIAGNTGVHDKAAGAEKNAAADEPVAVPDDKRQAVIARGADEAGNDAALPASQKEKSKKQRASAVKRGSRESDTTIVRPPVTPNIETDNIPPTAYTVPPEQTADALAAEQPQQSNVRKSVTIILDAEMVNEKYLTKHQTTEATSHGKGASAFRKVLDIANDLKHNQDPIGDLRQKKDEILAFNFKRGKDRNDN